MSPEAPAASPFVRLVTPFAREVRTVPETACQATRADYACDRVTPGWAFCQTVTLREVTCFLKIEALSLPSYPGRERPGASPRLRSGVTGLGAALCPLADAVAVALSGGAVRSQRRGVLRALRSLGLGELGLPSQSCRSRMPRP